MTDPTVTLRLNAENRQLLPPVRQARDAVNDLGDAGQAAGRRGGDGVRRFGDEASTADRRVRTLSTSARELSKATLSIGAGFGVARLGAEAIRAADLYANLSGRLRLATNGEREFATARAETFAISQRTSTQLESTVALYSRLAQSTAEYNITQARQLALTETINQTFAVSGASNVAAANTITQLTQALAGGVLRAEEFNSVIENSPRLAQALADGLGVGMGRLRAMVNDGQVDVEAMIRALESQAETIRTEFDSLPLTVERAMTQMRNSLTKFAGEASESFGLSSGLANGISVLASNLDELDRVVGVVAIAFAGRLVGSLAETTAEFVRTKLQAQATAQAELAAARAAETHAAARLAAARAGIGAAGSMAAAEAQLAAAQLRTAAATQSASVALQAKAAATRAAGAALALFGGPVGVAVTALTLFAMWAAKGSSESAKLREIVDGLGKSADEAADRFERLNRAQQAGVIVEVSRDVKKATSDLLGDVMRMESTIAGLGIQRPYVEAQRAVRELREEWSAGRITGDQFSSGLVEQVEGLRNSGAAHSSLVDQLVRLAAGVGTSSRELDAQRAILDAVTGKHHAAAAAASGNAAAHRDLAAAAKIDWADIDKALNQQSASAQLRNIELTQGKAARRRVELEELLPDTANRTAEAETRRAQIESILKTEAANDKLAESARGVTKAETSAQRVADELQRTREQQAESQARYANEAAMAAAELAGPVKEAEEQRRQRIVALDAELKKLNITQQTHTALVEAARAAEAKRIKELNVVQAAPRALLDAMTGELQLLAQVGDRREILTRQLQAEEDMRRAITDAIEAGNAALMNSPGEQDRLIAQARAMAAYSLEIEDNAYRLEEWADVATRGVAGVADVFADLFSRQIRNSKDFFRSLRDVFKNGFADIMRTLLEQEMVRPFQKAVLGMLSGQGYAAAGQPVGNYAAALAEGVTGQVVNGVSGAIVNGVSQGMAGYFGGSAGSAATTGAAAAGFRQMVLVDGQLVEVVSGGGGGGFGSSGGLLNAKMLTGEFAGGMPYASAAMGLMGLYYGATKTGNGGLSSAVGAASYGALGVAAGGAIAGGVGAIGAGVGAGGIAAGAAGGATTAMASLGGASWIPVVGWVLAAIAAVDLVSGGKLLGTRFSAEEVSQELSIDNAGGSASAEIYEERKKSLFRGTARRWRDVEASDEAKEAADVLYRAIEGVARTAANQIGVDMTDLVSGTFKGTYDKKGHLKSEISTVLGRTYEEGLEAFQKRLSAENIIAQVSVLDRTASAVAERWRANADTLLEGAQFMLTAATDVANGLDLWSTQGLGALTKLLERMQIGDESLAQTYQRMSSTAMQYGDFIAGIDGSIRTAGLNEFQRAALDVEMQYRDQVRTANDLAKALGLSGARAEDLAKIEQLRALGMADLQLAIQRERDRAQQDLSIGQYSPLNDADKLSEVMSQLSASVAQGDTQRARSLSDAALSLGRNLYASGNDYNSLFAQVNGILDGLGEGLDLDMDDGTTMSELADALTVLPKNIASELFALLYPAAAQTPASPASALGGASTEAKLDAMVGLLAEIAGTGRESMQRELEHRLVLR